MKERYDVGGMSCAACSAAVERAVRRLEGVTEASVNLNAKSLICEHDERVRSADIVRAVKKAGYTAKLHTGVQTENGEREKAERRVLLRLILSAVLLLPLMYLSMGGMLGLPMPAWAADRFAHALAQLCLALPILVINHKFFVSGVKSTLNGSPNMDALVTVGSAASFLYSVWITIQRYTGTDGDASLYFESSAMILTLVTVGKYLEERAKAKSGRAVQSLLDLSPKTAHVRRDGAELEIPAAELQVGDVVLIRAGDRVPADGSVLTGSASFDQSALTGESIPREVGEGESLLCASVCTGGYLEFTAEKVGSDTTLAKMIEIVDNAGASKARAARLADRVSGIFVPCVLAIALVTFVLWMVFTRDTAFAVRCGVSVLVISCPCALGLATPVAITAAIGHCARNGVLVKSAEAIEDVREAGCVVFDKTGTLTVGHPSVTDVIPVSLDERTLILRAAQLEAGSSHPLAKAVEDFAGDFERAALNDFTLLPGRGISAEIEGVRHYAGSLRTMEELHVEVPDEVLRRCGSLASEGKTVMAFAREEDGALRLSGILAAADTVKPEAAETVAKIREAGLRVVMLTGDNRLTAAAVGKMLSLPDDDVIAEVLPADKAETVSRLNRDGGAVMVGDGINDSPALAAAQVGIAVGGGTDIASETADAVLMSRNGSLHALPDFLLYARRVVRIIRQNLFWAFFYNVLGIPIAAGVFYPVFGLTLNPMLAAAAMSCSSLFVVTNALRLR